MAYIQRDAEGKIIGYCKNARPQTFNAQTNKYEDDLNFEFAQENSQEVQDFLNK